MIELPTLDDRTHADFVSGGRALIPSLSTEWTDHNPSDPGIVLVELFAWLAEIVLYRIDRVPDRSYRTFLDLLRGPPPDGDTLDLLPLDTAIRTVVAQLRDRRRAITIDDFEHLVTDRWPALPSAQAMGVLGAIRRTRCIAEQSPATLVDSWRPGAPRAEGHVTVVVAADSLAAAQRDLPSFDPARRFAFELDGTSAFIDCGADASLAITGALTVSAWIFPRNLGPSGQTGPRQGIVCKAAAGEYELVLEPYGALTFIHADGHDGGTSPAGVVGIGQWSHVAAVRAADHSSVTLFVNAQPVKTIALTRAPVATTSPVLIGRRSSGTDSFNGFIRDVAIWADLPGDAQRNTHTGVRTAVQLGADMRHVLPGADDSPGTVSRPTAYWRLDALPPQGAAVPDSETPAAATGAQRTRDGTLHGGGFRDVTRPLAAFQPMLDGLFTFLDEWRLLTTKVDVIDHAPLRVTVTAKLYLLPDADVAAVTAAVPAAFDAYLDPLTGWRGQGWPFGRAVYNLDLEGILDGIPGVDFAMNAQVALVDAAQIAAVAAGVRPPPPRDESGRPIGVSLLPTELPAFAGTTLTLFQRAGTQWVAL